MARYALAATTALLLVALGTLAACGSSSVNSAISIAPGEKTGDVATVNGGVNVGEGATVGSATTINGDVTLGSHVTAHSVKTVNGEVKLGDSTKVSGGVMTVNGALLLDKGADVGGKLTNVNGDIRLAAAHVGGGITTVNGDIDVGSGSRVEGGIHVGKADFATETKDRKLPRIVIGPGAVVEGPLRFEREVVLYVSDSATVSGPIEGATAQKFSGDQPPG